MLNNLSLEQIDAVRRLYDAAEIAAVVTGRDVKEVISLLLPASKPPEPRTPRLELVRGAA